MRPLLHMAAAMVLAHSALAEVKVEIGEINDKRTTGKFFAGLEIQLKLTGPELAEAKGIRTTVKTITDDTGKTVPASKNAFHRDGFEELQMAFNFGSNSGEKKAEEFQVKLEFANPPRTAKALKELSGTIELLLPAKDPTGIVTASVAKDAGKPLDNAALKAAGIELKLLKSEPGAKKPAGLSFSSNLGENDLGYEITDPKNKVASVEFFNAAGKKLESNSRMSTGFNGTNSVTMSFKEKPPADAVAKVYIVTDKSVLTVPLAFKDIALP